MSFNKTTQFCALIALARRKADLSTVNPTTERRCSSCASSIRTALFHTDSRQPEIRLEIIHSSTLPSTLSTASIHGMAGSNTYTNSYTDANADPCTNAGSDTCSNACANSCTNANADTSSHT